MNTSSHIFLVNYWLLYCCAIETIKKKKKSRKCEVTFCSQDRAACCLTGFWKHHKFTIVDPASKWETSDFETQEWHAFLHYYWKGDLPQFTVYKLNPKKSYLILIFFSPIASKTSFGCGNVVTIRLYILFTTTNSIYNNAQSKKNTFCSSFIYLFLPRQEGIYSALQNI